MTAALLLVAALTSCPSTRPADTATVTWVCLDGGWRPTSPTPTPTPTPPGTPDAPVCDPRPNPYAEPDRAAACAAWAATHDPVPAPPLPTFVVGGIYRDPYRVQIAILAVSRSLEGVPVITAQYVTTYPGRVFSFRADDVTAQLWTPQF